jgi:signal transduction histidine kinase
LNEKQEEYLADILSSSEHLLALINDILDLSKVEAGQVELEIAPFSLREALERGVVMVKERGMRSGVELGLTIDPSVEVVAADERRIRQVVFNLLSNAVKFTPAPGRVVVSLATEPAARPAAGPADADPASARPSLVEIAIRDTGPGIEPADQERIFEKFVRIAGAATPGTGLGLPISRELARLHGGDLTVESSPGLGSTFIVRMPRVYP